MGPAARTVSRGTLGTKTELYNDSARGSPLAGDPSPTGFASQGQGWGQEIEFSHTESLILAQDERWRRALHMQVVRERGNQLAGDPE